MSDITDSIKDEEKLDDYFRSQSELTALRAEVKKEICIVPPSKTLLATFGVDIGTQIVSLPLYLLVRLFLCRKKVNGKDL
jgi:hypothetical protein